MSDHFDEEPGGDPHGECALEINRLKAECERLRADMKKLRKSLESIVDNDTYETEYDGRMYTHCHSCNYDSDKPSTAKHDATCDYVLARKVMADIDAARAKP